MTLLWALIVIMGVIVLVLGSSVRVINQYQRGVVLRFGQLREAPRGPGLTLIAPIADRLHKVNMQVVTMPVPAQDGITRDNVTVQVDAVVYFRVIDPVQASWSTCRTTTPPSRRWRRPRCGRSSARASSTTCCPTASGSTRASR